MATGEGAPGGAGSAGQAARVPVKIAFSVPVVPVPKARARVTRFGTFTPKRTRKAEQAVAWIASQYAPREPLEGPVFVALSFFMPIAKSWTKTERELAARGLARPATRGTDIDNLAKLVLDALTAARFWQDDGQVVELVAKKWYALEPRVEVTVGELGAGPPGAFPIPRRPRFLPPRGTRPRARARRAGGAGPPARATGRPAGA